MTWLRETRGVKFELTRHFLSRMFDGEWSSERGTWQTLAAWVFGLLLPSGMLIVKEGSFDFADAAKYRRLSELASPEPFRAAAVADELSLLVLILAVTGLIALLVWQSLFPGQRDYLALAGLPVRARQVFLGRFGAVLLFSTALVAVMNVLPSILAPIEFGGAWQKNPSYLANFTAQAVASGLECFFIFFAIVALQGILLNALTGRAFARVSVYVQGTLIAALMFAALRSGSIQDWTPADIARLPEIGRWIPPVWFLGLHEWLLGDRDPFFAAMAGRAMLGAAAAVGLAALMYLVSYRRYRRLLVEAPAARTRSRMPWSLLDLLSREPRQQAVMQFMAKTLARSRSHRMVWLAYIGGAVALLLNSSIIDGALLARGRNWHQALKFLVLFWPLACSAVLLPGFRHVLRIPAELRANWIFQLTESQGRAQWMRAVERFVIVYAIAPVYLLLAPAAIRVVGWPIALRMTVLQVLVTMLAFEILFYSWQQLPFTCSYVPGKRPLAGIVGGYILALGAAVPMLTYFIASGAQFPPLFVIMFLMFGAGWLKARQLRREGWGEAGLLYEDTGSMLTDLTGTDTRPVQTVQARREKRVKQREPRQRALSWQQDLRYGLRQMRRSPAFTAIAAGTLGLGIGATTSIFSMIDTVLWRPVLLRNPQSLVFVLQNLPSDPRFYSPASPADIEDIRRANTTMEDIASWRIGSVNLVDAGGEAIRVDSASVTANLFDVLQAQPAMGRRFMPGEDYPGRERRVILSDELWRGHFDADPDLLGRSIRLDDRDFTVVGVMRPDFQFPRNNKQLWIPLALTPEERHSRSALMVDSVGRLKPGRTMAQAAAELKSLGARLEEMHPETNRNRRFEAWPYHRYMVGDYVPVYTAMLLGGALCVLLIACGNVANLQFARAGRRAREVAVRTALGAGRWRIVRQLLTESVLVSLAGAVLGVFMARWGLALIKAGVPPEMRQYMAGWKDIGLNVNALTFALVAAVGSGILAGLSPAWRCSRPNLGEALKEGGQASSAGRGRHRLRRVLVAAEVAVAVVLLVGAGVMVHGFQSMVGVSTGVEPATLLTVHLSLTESKYHDSRRVAAFYGEVLARVRAMPGVRTAAAATAVPFSRHMTSQPFAIEGRPQEPGAPPAVQAQAVTPEFFRSMNIPLRAGRFPSAADGPDAPRVAVVSESMAGRWWPRESPIGRRIRLGAQGRWLTVAGVVGDIPYSVMDRTPRQVVYFPFEQAPDLGMDIAIRTAGDPMQLAPAVRAAIRAIDPEQPITNLSAMPMLIRQEAFVFAYMAALMGTLGTMALVLAVVGVSGVMAYLVSDQTHEIGIRIALGAPRGNVMGMLFRRGMTTVAIGLVIGLVPAYGLARLMAFAVLGAKAGDPAAFVGIPLALLFAAALAIYIPARRAMRIDPITALRNE